MKKLFSEKQVGIAAVIGGPIPPGIIFYLNYSRLGKEKEAYVSMAATLILSLLFFYTIILLPENILDNIPNPVISSIYGVVYFFLYKRFLADKVDQEINNGSAEKASNWSVALVTVIGLVLTLVAILTIAFTQPAFKGDRLTFGKVKHEIFFNRNETSEDDVRKLAAVLTDAGFFSDEYAVAVLLENWNTRYVVTLQIDKSYWYEPDVLEYLEDLRSVLEQEFQKDVTLLLEHYDLSGKRHEKWIGTVD